MTTFLRPLASQLLHLDRTRMDGWIALRNTLGFTVALVTGSLWISPAVGLVVGTGALVVSYSDGRDPHSDRLQRMVISSFLCALGILSGSVAASHFGLVASLTAAWGFAAGLLVVLGEAAATLGVVSTVMFLVSSAHALAWPEALKLSGLVFLGGLLQTWLALLFWPVSQRMPERRELEKLFLEFAQMAVSRMRSHEAPPASVQSTRLFALAETQDESFRLVLGQAERIRLRIFSLLRLRKHLRRMNPEDPSAQDIQHFLRLAAKELETIASLFITREIKDSDPTLAGAMAGLTEKVRQACTRAESPFQAAVLRDAASKMEALAGQLRATRELAPRSLSRMGVLNLPQTRGSQLTKIGNALRANLTLQSAAFRHALRLAACLVLGEYLERKLSLERGYWVTMTTALVLKPDFSATFSRGILRVAGTLGGLALASALLHFLVPGAALMVALCAACVLLLRWLGPAQYGIFTFAISALVVLMMALTGTDSSVVIQERGINTLIGGLVALLAYMLWPTWEKQRLPEVLAQMLDAYREYVRVVSRESEGERESVRLQCRVTRSNFQASLLRLEAEPGTSREERVLVQAIFASSNRFIHSVMGLEQASGEAFSTFLQDVDQTLALLAAALRGKAIPSRDYPDLRASYRESPNAILHLECDRLVNSLNTLREQILKLKRA